MQIPINGLSTRVELDGAANKPVVMFSHSLAQDLCMWDPQVRLLAPRYRTLRYDTRGHGGTQRPTSSFSVEDLADDVAAILASLDIPRVHFVGLSMGGMIGQALALKYPQLVGKLVLSNTLSAYGPESAPMWQERIDAASGPDGMEPLVEPTVTRWFTEPFRRTESEVIEWVRSLIRRTSVDGFTQCCRALMKLGLTEQLPTIQAPTLVIAGRQDPTTTVVGAQIIAAGIPAARLEVIENAAHISNIEQPQIFGGLLLDFLAQEGIAQGNRSYER
ncbi:alpha/beta fold hydrolase [Alcaligenaceae bacterium]|nr:alpha/beta fold hydrolase [Alcaligenaceae bacterium]